MQASLFKILPAEPEDVAVILDLIYEMAEYENLTGMVQADEEKLRHAIFTEHSVCAALLYEGEAVIGYLLYFYNFSSFLCKKGLYIEDIFLLEEHRKKGYGKAAFEYLRNIAAKENCGRMEWTCLNWNTSSQNFYSAMGAERIPEWEIWRLVL